MNLKNLPRRLYLLSLLIVLSAALVTAQQSRGSLRGLITDELGAVMVGVNVTLTDATGTQKKTTTNGEGVYTFAGLAPGKYTLQAVAPGFAPSENKEVDITNARQTVDLTLRVTIEEKVTVAETPVSTEATNNANQTVIAGKDLDALPDDPDELAAALQALAGPSVGPNGGQIFIDGFTGSTLPSKDAIREIRINQNPFAAENDQPSARIDILTRPGTDKFRGGTSINFNDESLNSRNPFAVNSSKRTPFQIRQYDMNISGPIVKRKASFFFNLGRIETDDNELVKASVLDDNLNVVNFGEAFVVPRRTLFFSPRLDYAINPDNTLVVRYNYNRFRAENQGIGGFNLPERGFNLLTINHTVQLTETAILNPTTINETRFQFTRGTTELDGNNSVPALDVSGSFGSGGSQVGQSLNERTTWELNNFTAKQRGTHAIKFGGRIRHIKIDDTNEGNFGGSWVFTGGFGESSIERYQKTLRLQEQGLTPAAIRAAGGGATAFRINAGNPFADVNQTDLGVFIQDDWRIRPNITFSFGLRYEIQTNSDSKYNFAPRLAMAWSPGAANSARPPKMVIRVGTGFFYNRFNEGNTLQAHRFNGFNVIQTAITEPFDRSSPPSVIEQQLPNVAAIYNVLNQWSPTAVPTVTGLPATQQTTWLVDPNLQNPTVWVLGTQVERQLPRNITMFLGFFNLRIVHVIRARDINAPLPATITELTPNGIRPDPTRGEINRYEASGQFNQRHFFVGFNSRLSRTLQFNANYSISKTTNDTDGQGSALFPMNSYDLSGEFGRSSFDIRHRFTIFGTINLPWWKLVLNPFVIANTGPGFNITTGQDRNLDRQFNERPSFAGPNANCSAANIRCTRFGNFNLTPLPGETIIPRNFGQAPGSFVANLRISRTFAFGVINRGNAAAARPAAAGGPGGPAPAAGGPGVQRVAGGPGPQGGGGAAAPSEKRYNLNVSINFQNILNRVNLGTPVGNLSSPDFGESVGLAPTFGGFGGPGGGSTGAGNRRIYAQVRLNF
ncbi:MAG TPA: carboxypeptidase regulatory-like domain-containing protein [Pyrinomonadaceae bacterium]|nr:carboxypeptidase regulatory-like domain-containing protein [Pyrinomonadaceae bacterium]